ncbi:peroxisomal biogenesis factor 11 [Tricladium varicosporioides]|nr:peroxisomal biogenesis factor 11 [Hymenoscyphus varicosporioides]
MVSIKQVTNFTNDAAGLEKVLRLFQSLAQIAADSNQPQAQAFNQFRRQLAIGRRYFRFLKFYDAFLIAWTVFISQSDGSGKASRIVRVIDSIRWACLGTYLLLEATTILDAMGVYNVTWAKVMFLEANKFWFYSLSLGISLSLVQLWSLYTESPISGKTGNEKRRKEEKKTFKSEKVKWEMERNKVVRKLALDSFDLFIPGYTTRWLGISSANVGYCSVMSTILGSVDIWERVQRP